ncbi:MAG: sporadic carbohydrate cluster 2OG-Fe(II) oxygenase [Pseudomonadota bacterium]
MPQTAQLHKPDIAEENLYSGFIKKEENTLMQNFLAKGIISVKVEDRNALDKIRDFLADTAAVWLQLPVQKDKGKFLDNIHNHISVEKLNDFRLALLNEMKKQAWLRPAYFALAKNTLEIIVGNELAMQRNVNLSIQLPNDDSSLLPIHSDVWSGDSPYEIVLWVPYVNCFATKSMYFCDLKTDEKLQPNLSDFQNKTSEDLYYRVAKDAPFMDVPYGEVLLFTQNIMHGNRVNIENESRWSSNCRFKSVLSPYSDKKLGEFFEPITLRPATRFGLRYKLPEGF